MTLADDTATVRLACLEQISELDSVTAAGQVELLHRVAVLLTRGAIAIDSRLAARRGAKQLAKTKLRRLPRARAKVRHTARRVKAGARRGYRRVSLRYRRKMNRAAQDCFALGGSSYFAFGSLKYAIVACGSAAYGQLRK